MSNRNGHNPHDLVAARIVAGAMEASQLPPAAARAVFRSMGAAGIPVPEPKPEAPAPMSLALPVAEKPETPPLDVQEVAAALGTVVWRKQQAVLCEAAAARLGKSTTPADLEALETEGRFTGFRYDDGLTGYELDGTELITFWPPEAAMEDGAVYVSLHFRLPL